MSISVTTDNPTQNTLKRIALVGNPNSGKTSLFNRLTGLNQKVGNFPGVTVDKKTGLLKLPNGKTLPVIDLPGTYSLYPTSLDERIVLEVLLQDQYPEHPDLIVYVADSTNLERHLLMLTQIIDLGFPVILALNMTDLADKASIQIDISALQEVLDVPVVKVNGRNGTGIHELKILLQNFPVSKKPNEFLFPIPKQNKELVNSLKALLKVDNDYRALMLAHHGATLKQVSAQNQLQIKGLTEKADFKSIRGQVDETMYRYEVINHLLERAVKRTGNNTSRSFTDRLDDIITHRAYGLGIFFIILFLMFQAVFSWAETPMELIETGFGWLSKTVAETLPQNWINGVISEGVIPGLGGVLVFIPQIAILFLLITLLEEVGYMSRAVFMSDRLLRNFGLNGRSIVSLISGVACAIPAIMSTRTIGNWKERMITIFVTPLISCSARIPVFAVLVAFVVPHDSSFLGIFNMQGAVIMGLYLLGAGAAIFSAWVLKLVLKTEEKSYFIMELPSYKTPYWKNVLLTVYEKVKTFVLEAGKIILIISIVLWCLASFGPGEKMQIAEEAAKTEATAQMLSEADAQALVASRKIEASYAGHFGKLIEPTIRPLGFDWKIGIALITSFAAREVFVGTMATIYSVGDVDNESSIIERMRKEKRPDTGEPVFDLPTSLSLLIYYVFAMQCMSTVAVVKRETKSWKWPILQLVYMSALAYLASFFVYQLLS